MPGSSAPTIAPHGLQSAPDRAAPGASRLAAASGERTSLPRDLAARRAAAPARRLQRRAADAAAARVPAGLRRRGDQDTRGEPRATTIPFRQPGSLAAAQWFRGPARAVRVADPHGDASAPKSPGSARSQLQNLIAEAAGRSPRAIVVMAHRDNDGRGPGANDNASGTAMLIQLARAYGVPPGLPSGQLRPNHTILFLSTDGGAYGGVGADVVRNALSLSERRRRCHQPRLGRQATGASESSSTATRRASRRGTFLQTVAARVAAQTGRQPGSAERAAPADRSRLPVLALRTGAVPLAGHRRRDTHDRRRQAARSCQRHHGPVERRQARPDRTRCAGRARDARRGSRVRAGHVDLRVPRLPPHPRLGGRARADRVSVAVSGNSDRPVRALPATAHPACARASRVPQPARLLGLGRRALRALQRCFGAWPHGAARPIPPTSALAGDWPVKALLALAVLALLGWLVARERSIPRRAITVEEELAGHTASLLCLGALSLLVVATNPFALLFLLPSLHVWLWLPQVRGRAAGCQAGGARRRLRRARATARLLRRCGSGSGWDALWYLAQLRAVGYVPFVVMPLLVVWLAGTGQLAALARVVTRLTRQRTNFRPPARCGESCAQPFSRCVTGAAERPAAPQEALEG